MASLQEFIQLATKQLGISENAAKSGTGGLLAVVQKVADNKDFQQLLAQFPDAAALLKFAPAGAAGASAGASAGAAAGASAGSAGTGGMLGGMVSKAAGAFGGQAGAAMNVLNMLQSAGIGADKAGRFATEFLTFVKSKLPNDLVQRLLNKAGDLKALAG